MGQVREQPQVRGTEAKPLLLVRVQSFSFSGSEKGEQWGNFKSNSRKEAKHGSNFKSRYAWQCILQLSRAALHCWFW